MSGGFFPAPEAIIAALGPAQAVMYGRIWRYCQGGGTCYASAATIAKECGISKRTVLRWVAKLVELEYLTAESGRDAGKTSTIKTTRKWVMGGNPNSEGVTESHGGCDTESRGGVTESHTKRRLEDKKEDNDLAPSPETSPAPPRAKRAKRAKPEPSDSATTPRPLFDAFLVTFPTAPASVAGRFNSTCNRLGYTLEQWGRWLAERETTDFLSRGIITRNNALDRFSRWVEDARPRATASNAPARRQPAGAPDDWATIVYTHDGTRRASVLFLPLLGLDRFAPPETWPAWLREFEGDQ